MNSKFYELTQEKQWTILNASFKTFAKAGYRKASTADIALEAGVSKSLLFHYFGSKLELFTYLFQYSIDFMSKDLGSFPYKEKEDLFEMIHRANVIKLEVFKTHPYLYQFIYRAYYEEAPEVRAVVGKLNYNLISDNYAEVLKHMDCSSIKQGIAPEQIIHIILWVSDGFLQSKLLKNDIDPDQLLADFEKWMGVLKLTFYQ